MLTRQEAQVMSEKELQMEMTKAMQAYKYVFVQCSSTDMERLSTLYSANPEGRLFVVDNYQEEIMKAFHKANKRYSNWFSFKDRHNYKREDNLMQQMIEKGFCLLIRENGFENKFKQELLAKLPQKDRLLIYSMWAGYLVPGANLNEHHMRLVSEFDNVAYLHTSGHATPDCLALVCERVKVSKAIIPIHSELSSLFNSLPIDPTYKSLVMLQSVELEGLSIVVNNPSSV